MRRPQSVSQRCTQNELAQQKLFAEADYIRDSMPYFAYLLEGYCLWPYLDIGSFA